MSGHFRAVILISATIVKCGKPFWAIVEESRSVELGFSTPEAQQFLLVPIPTWRYRCFSWPKENSTVRYCVAYLVAWKAWENICKAECGITTLCREKSGSWSSEELGRVKAWKGFKKHSRLVLPKQFYSTNTKNGLHRGRYLFFVLNIYFFFCFSELRFWVQIGGAGRANSGGCRARHRLLSKWVG